MNPLSASKLRAIDTRVLVGSILLMAVLAVYRSYNYWTTGFFVSDEYGYFYDAVHGVIYGDRWFFGWANIILFKALGITSVDAFSYLLPFYMFFWTGLTFIVFYKLLKLLDFDRVTVALSLASSFVLISFVLLSLGFLTEPVGLCMTMVGIYFLARYMKSKRVADTLASPLLSACFFGFAAGTREPYNAFLIGGIVIMLVLAFAKRKEALGTRRFGKKTVLAVSFVVFVLASLFFLYVPSHSYTQQVGPISSQLLQSLVLNPHTSGGSASTTTITSTITINNTVTTTTSTVVAPPNYPFYKQFVVTNTLLIFFGGILLGWGPICFVIGLSGFLILLERCIRKKDVSERFLFLTALTALGSYLVVSFIYAPDPTYFSFTNYSTLIRFSDTALPGYFLTAPLVMAFVSKSRKLMGAMLVIFIAFLLIAVPAYQIYAASNFSYTTSQNPFQPGYRTDAALLRNYFDSNAANNQMINLVGLPYGWSFTPGVEDLRSIHAYWIGVNPIFPSLSVSNFTSDRWPVFYLFVSGAQTLPSNSQSLLQFVTQTQPSNQTEISQFRIVGSQAVLTGPDFTLYEIQLNWQ